MRDGAAGAGHVDELPVGVVDLGREPRVDALPREARGAAQVEVGVERRPLRDVVDEDEVVGLLGRGVRGVLQDGSQGEPHVDLTVGGVHVAGGDRHGLREDVDVLPVAVGRAAVEVHARTLCAVAADAQRCGRPEVRVRLVGRCDGGGEALASRGEIEPRVRLRRLYGDAVVEEGVDRPPGGGRAGRPRLEAAVRPERARDLADRLGRARTAVRRTGNEGQARHEGAGDTPLFRSCESHGSTPRKEKPECRSMASSGGGCQLVRDGCSDAAVLPRSYGSQGPSANQRASKCSPNVQNASRWGTPSSLLAAEVQAHVEPVAAQVGGETPVPHRREVPVGAGRGDVRVGEGLEPVEQA